MSAVKRVLAALILVAVLWQGWYFGWVLWWKWFNPDMTSFMSLRVDELREKNPKAQLKHQWVPYAKISANLKRAVVAAEDDKFIEVW